MKDEAQQAYNQGWEDGAQAEKKMMEADLLEIIKYFDEHKDYGKSRRLRAILPRPVDVFYLKRLYKKTNPPLGKK